MKISSINSFLFILLFNQLLSAGITGKISGKVRDAETREPLPGANIIIERTTMGAASDVEGVFFILNIHKKISLIKFQCLLKC